MEWTLLLIVTFLAATVQSATGFGFGLIAVSVFLILLNSVAAIQIVIIITLIMSCIHWPKLRGLAPTNLLKWLLVGCTLGFPLGILVFELLDIEAIKMVVAILIILISLQNGWLLFAGQKQNTKSNDQQHKTSTVLGVGIVSGLMASAMAMPGPAIMLYLSRTSLSKNEIRGTIITSFVFSYAGALVLQTAFVGIDSQTWVTAGMLTPAALIGVVAGHMLSNKINQKLFKWLILLVLLLTGLFMLFNL
ncbi:MAG: sulfite exporter TauE/SafE family protein [Rhizobiales bacterium]|nr:sulfite exporter TauE/SafE family protein [Hyphomicrobiales bacterium]NRB13176.1 sulfite exporter TauE/SafE family protein [Hyphomicrobiales bacterium]